MPSSSRSEPRHRNGISGSRGGPNPCAFRCALVAAIAVIVVAGAAAFSLFKPSSGAGGLSTPSPTVTRSAPAPSASPQASQYAIDLTTWTSYTSTRYAFSISHPADWTLIPATRAWDFPADATVYGSQNAGTENFLAANGDVAASAWSVAVSPGTTADAWTQAYCLEAESDNQCNALATQTVAATMDGHAGSLVSFREDTQAFFLVQDRIYVVAIWRPADYIPGGVPRLLEAYLSTMHLLPGGPAAPSPSPRSS